MGLEAWGLYIPNQKRPLSHDEDQQEVFKNMFKSLKSGGKIAVQFVDGIHPSALHAFKVLNPENADRMNSRMLQCEDKAKVENYCSKAGFHIVKCYYSTFSELVFQC